MPVVYSRKRLRANPPSQEQQPSKQPPDPDERPPPERPESAAGRRQQQPRKRKRYTQLHIDAGQKDLVTTCRICKMLYTPGKDDTLHTRYHRRSPLPRWSPSTMSATVGTHARLVLHLLSSDSCAGRTAARIDAFVSDILGTEISFPKGRWLLIAAVGESLVRGVCICERIKTARLLTGRTLGEVDEGAVLGVRKIWVDPHFRGKGLASRMLEEACLALIYGHVVARNFVAFTAMTEDGTAFARRFCGGRVLVYDVRHCTEGDGVGGSGEADQGPGM